MTAWMVLAFGNAAWASPAPTADHQHFDAIIEEVIARYQLPGIAVGVIEDGRISYVRTAGEVVAGSGRPITPDTLFKIASNSKAMTASVLARLVDAGKLSWDDPVQKHLPQFRMHDPWVSREIQVRDLLIHNSGLREGAGDLMLWPEPNHFDREDIIAGLAHLEPQHSFRSRYAYDNLLYVVAGEVAAAASGASYEELVRSEVFEPLGLSDCRVGQIDRDAVADIAQPHMRRDERNVVIRADGAVIPAITSAAAGGIRCSLDDMLAWAQNWLAPTPPQQAWLSPEQRGAMWTAHMPMPISQRRRDWNGSHFYAYGYGWRLADIEGVWSVSHTGTLAGMYSVLHLLPEQRSGFVVMINGSGGAARTVLDQVLAEHFTNPQSAGSVARYADALASESSAPDRPAEPDTSSRRPADVQELARWLGTYRDPWFGEVTVCERAGGVQFESAKSPMLVGEVMRVGERYLVDWHVDSVDAEAWLSFAGGDDGPTLAMAKVDPDADFSYDYEDLAFTRTAACR
ncbi:MAG: serine hydrolase [Proteobacteria bacterium]|nr:serine hydrolase [Pseudomonadota bacterium]